MIRTKQLLRNTLLAGLLFPGIDIHAAQDEAVEWVSTHTQDIPVLDGVVDPVWNNAIPLSVTVREAFGGTHPQQVILRALHTDNAFYVLAQWPDNTRSDMRDPYLWNSASNTYERPTTPDDQFALEFPLQGELLISMLPEGQAYTADVWHWKAGRSNLGGWVDDKRHIISPTPVAGGRAYQMGGRAEVFVARPMDAGKESYVLVPPPADYQGDIVPSYAPQLPDGSQADVRGKGVHNGNAWTLEMSRGFATGHAEDAVLNVNDTIECAIAILDDELYWHHSVSGKLLLRFSN